MEGLLAAVRVQAKVVPQQSSACRGNDRDSTAGRIAGIILVSSSETARPPPPTPAAAETRRLGGSGWWETMSLRILQLNSARLFVGEAAHTLNLTEALRAAGHQVWLGLRKGHFTIEVARQRGLDPIEFNMPKRLRLSEELPDAKHIAKLVRDEGVQLIHTHRGKEHWQAVLAVRLYRLRVPVIRTRHVVTPLKKHMANRWLARRTARLIAVSCAVECDVRSTGMYPDDRVVRIPGGVDLERFRAMGTRAETRGLLGLPQSAPVAICVARMAKVKAHRVLLDAWIGVRREIPDAVLLLVGDGALRAEVEAQAARLGMRETALRFLGGRPNEELPGLLSAADVGVLASVGSEGFSRAVLEYMATGLPVVATRVGAVPDLIEDGVSGRLVAPEDVDGMGKALVEILRASPDVRRVMGARGRERAERRHGYTAWAETHVRLYQDVLEEQQAR